MKKRILIVASQHGNELLGEELYDYISCYHSSLLPYIDYYLANPRARKSNVRYIESDMNRSYGLAINTYESRQAEKLSRYIRNNGHEIILDIHTTTCEQEPCFIAYNLNGPILSYINASQVNKIVQMPERLARNTLIGMFENAISVEVSNSELSNQTYEMLSKNIVAYLNKYKEQSSKQLYQITGKIMKIGAPKDLENFKMSAAGFIPVLVGENSYKKQTDYLGFKANNVTEVRL